MMIDGYEHIPRRYIAAYWARHHQGQQRIQHGLQQFSVNPSFRARFLLSTYSFQDPAKRA